MHLFVCLYSLLPRSDSSWFVEFPVVRFFVFVYIVHSLSYSLYSRYHGIVFHLHDIDMHSTFFIFPQCAISSGIGIIIASLTFSNALLYTFISFITVIYFICIVTASLFILSSLHGFDIHHTLFTFILQPF